MDRTEPDRDRHPRGGLTGPVTAQLLHHGKYNETGRLLTENAPCRKQQHDPAADHHHQRTGDTTNSIAEEEHRTNTCWIIPADLKPCGSTREQHQTKDIELVKLQSVKASHLNIKQGSKILPNNKGQKIGHLWR